MITWDGNMKSLLHSGFRRNQMYRLENQALPSWASSQPCLLPSSRAVEFRDKSLWQPPADSQFIEFFSSLIPVSIDSNYILENTVQDQSNIHNKDNNYHGKKCHTPTIPQAVCWALYSAVLSNRVAVRHASIYIISNRIKKFVLYSY